MVEYIEALQDTWLKRDYRPADELSEHYKKFVKKGERYPVDSYDERDAGTDFGGHILVNMAYGTGTWYIYSLHWQMPWQIVVEKPPAKVPEWDQVDWNNWSAPVSKYFTVGEVTNMSRERIPTATDIKKNIIAIARQMDDIREWWDGPLGVNSWYRPWAVNTRIGSRAPNHPGGYAVDFRPLNGSVWDLQARFQKEWYDTGKWKGGFGLGANKGFIHIDLRDRRVWNY